MRLKILTATLVIFGVLLMLLWPVAVGQRPIDDASRVDKARWGQQVLVYFGITASVWLSTAMSALLLARQSRREFLEQERENLKSLIEGTLKDHDGNP